VCLKISAATTRAAGHTDCRDRDAPFIPLVVFLQRCISAAPLLFRYALAFPILGTLTYPPLMAGLPLRPVQNDLTSPTPVPVPRTPPKLISGITMALKPTPRALLFDVFGTCVDWRTTVVGELHAQSHAVLNSAAASLASRVRLLASDMTMDQWAMFAQQWRDSYKQFTRQSAADPASSWISIDEHHLRSLRVLIAEWKLEGLWDDQQLRQLSLVWHRLEPWADSAMGVALLNRLFCKS